VGKQKQFFTEFGTDVRVLQNVFLVFLTQFWLPRAGGGGVRIVSDTLVIFILMG